ncbi:MAG: MBL fold metallo-hydrolase [Proteobacteria bacterium]|nr:MBL fold metallo-hydrolase [Pseudomonadota bacterium]
MKALNWSASLFIVISVLNGCAQPEFDEKAWLREVESTMVEELYAEHYKDGKYFNPWIDVSKGISDILTWRFSSALHYSEEEKAYLPPFRDDTSDQILNNLENDFIVWIGHNTFLIKTGDQVWLTDPMFSKRALLPPRKTPPALKAEDINRLFPKVNVVISHNHYDHLDADSIEQLSQDYVYYVPVGLKHTLKDWQPKAEIIEMDWWETLKLGKGIEIHCLPAQHWSLRAFDGENTSLWASYMFITPETTVYFGGDSGYFIGYREIGRKYPKIDYALIPTTAYHPRWFMHKSHMNIEEALNAFQDLGADYFIPTQWGAFHLGDEPPGYPGLDLMHAIKSRKLDQSKYLILDIGELHIFKESSCNC